MKHQSSLLLFLQLAFAVLFFLTGPLFAAALGAWAVLLMVIKSKFSGHPEPKENARLLDTGPYKYIRNPMYSAILLALGALLLDYITWLRLSVYLIETLILLTKIPIEEKLLAQKFKGYSDYKSRTRRLIPFIY